MKYKNLLVITNNFPDEDDLYARDIFVKAQINSLKQYFDNIYVISPLAYGVAYLRKTKYSNYRCDNLHVYFPKYPNFPLFYYHGRKFWLDFEKRAIFNLITQENIQFDLVHAHFTWPSGAVAVELKKKYHVPVVITEHTHITLYKELEKMSKEYLDTWKLCDAIIRVNKKDIPLIASYNIDRSKIYHVPNGFDQSKMKIIPSEIARKRLGIPLNVKLILNIGRLSEEKGQKYLIDAMKEITESRNDVLCIIGGKGPLKKELQKQISDLALENFVKLIGFVPDNLLPVWMNACDTFVLPSLSESFGIVQIEAMACGKPVVATYNGGSEEIITSDDYGYLVNPASPSELSAKINLSLEKTWDCAKILKYSHEYKWSGVVKQIVSVYQKV